MLPFSINSHKFIYVHDKIIIWFKTVLKKQYIKINHSNELPNFEISDNNSKLGTWNYRFSS